MCAVLFAPGIIVYALARRENGEKIFAGYEMIIAIGLLILAAVAAYLMATGVISPL
jgi:arginine:ornithine antiporter/lysine permease